MPTLGTASGGSTIKPGVFIPQSSFPVAGPALKSAVQGSTLALVMAFGDSKTWGSAASGQAYSWFSNRLRERLVGDYGTTADGGRGWNAFANDGNIANVQLFGTEPVHATTTGTWGLSDLFMDIGMNASSTAGDSIIYNITTTKCAISWVRFIQGSRFTYQINGGTIVTVNAGFSDAPPYNVASNGGHSYDWLYLTAADGLTSGVDTLKITNLGGGGIYPPNVDTVTDSFNAGSTIPSGTTFWYKTTFLNSGNSTESTAGTAQSGTTSAVTHQLALANSTIANGGTSPDFPGSADKYRVYRATSSGGPYQFLADVAPAGSFKVLQYADIGAATNPAITPPVSSTLALNSDTPKIHVSVREYNAAGVVFDNHGNPGARTWDRFDTLDIYNSTRTLALLGVQWGTGSNGIPLYTDAEYLPAVADSGVDVPLARATTLSPKLVLLQMPSVNDEGSMDDITTTPQVPSVADGGVGVGSGLGAATYFYKVARLLPQQSGGWGALSTSASAAITAGHQAFVTTPALAQGDAPMPTFGIFRSTSSGGTYSYVGSISGANTVFIDNVATPGAAWAQTASVIIPTDPWRSVRALRRAIRICRNAGADVLVVLPDQTSGTGELHNGAITRAACAAECVASSVPYIDFDYALTKGSFAKAVAAGYAGNNSNVHRVLAAYQVMGDFLYDNVIKPLIAGIIT